jgi:hypothetical protein
MKRRIPWWVKNPHHKWFEVWHGVETVNAPVKTSKAEDPGPKKKPPQSVGYSVSISRKA